MRTSLRPGLLGAVARNAARGNPDVRLFEQGTVFFAPTPGDLLPIEHVFVAAVFAGQVRRMPRTDDRSVVVGDALDAVHALVEALGLADARIEEASIPGFHPTRCGRLLVDGVDAGAVGEVDREVLDGLGIAGTVAAFELDVTALRAGQRRSRIFRPISQYPPANIDLAFVVDDSVAAGDVLATLRANGTDLLETVSLFDTFRSEQLGAGRVSLAFALRFRAHDRTLTDADVAEVRAACIAAVEQSHGGQLRG